MKLGLIFCITTCVGCAGSVVPVQERTQVNIQETESLANWLESCLKQAPNKEAANRCYDITITNTKWDFCYTHGLQPNCKWTKTSDKEYSL